MIVKTIFLFKIMNLGLSTENHTRGMVTKSNLSLSWILLARSSLWSYYVLGDVSFHL